MPVQRRNTRLRLQAPAAARSCGTRFGYVDINPANAGYGSAAPRFWIFSCACSHADASARCMLIPELFRANRRSSQVMLLAVAGEVLNLCDVASSTAIGQQEIDVTVPPLSTQRLHRGALL